MGGRGNSDFSARRDLWPMFRCYERGIPWWEAGEGTDPAREGAQPGQARVLVGGSLRRPVPSSGC